MAIARERECAADVKKKEDSRTRRRRKEEEQRRSGRGIHQNLASHRMERNVQHPLHVDGTDVAALKMEEEVF